MGKGFDTDDEIFLSFFLKGKVTQTCNLVVAAMRIFLPCYSP